MKTVQRLLITGLVIATSATLLACGGSEGRKASFVARGEQYLAEGNLEKARVEFRNALQIDPRYAKARFLAGQTAERLGNVREAMGQYQAALDADPKYSSARAALARIYVFGGVMDKAEELVETGLKTDPNSAELLTVRGTAEARLGNAGAALDDALAANKINPGDPSAIALLAALYKHSGQLDKAVDIVKTGVARAPGNVDLHSVLADLELSRGLPDQAESELKKIIELDPKKAGHRYNLARFYLLQHNPDAAERTLREAVGFVPSEPEPKQVLVEMLSAQRGETAAEAEIQQQIKRAPDDTGLQLAFAAHYERHGNETRAEAIYRQVMQQAGLKADGLSARNRLAALLIRRNDLQQSGRLVEEVLKESPRDADALIIRGNLELARGDAPGAITDLRAVLRDQPTSLPVMRALARAHQQNNGLALAEETLRSALQIDPKDAQTRFDLAQLLVQTNRAEQAKPILEQLASDTPTSTATELLFRAQLITKDYPAARRTAQQIQSLRPSNPEGVFYAGLVDEAEQKLDDATKAFEHALQVQPLHSDSLAALVRLDLAANHADRALARLDPLIKKYPNYTVAFNLKGELLLAKHDFAGAASMFQGASASSPTWWVPYRGLALAQAGAQKSEAAITTLKNGFERSKNTLLLGDLATLYQKSGKTNEAIQTYEQWLTAEPKALAAANNLAMLLITTRQDAASLTRARALADQLAGSNDPGLLDTRGWVLYRSGDAKGGLPLLQQAIAGAPDSPLLRYHLAMLQLKSGDTKSARDNLERALAKEAGFAGVEDARNTLKQLKQSS